MKITLISTAAIVEINDGSLLARIWEGHTSSGIPVHALIPLISVSEEQNQLQFENELMEYHSIPSPDLIRYYGTTKAIYLLDQLEKERKAYYNDAICDITKCINIWKDSGDDISALLDQIVKFKKPI